MSEQAEAASLTQAQRSELIERMRHRLPASIQHYAIKLVLNDLRKVISEIGSAPVDLPPQPAVVKPASYVDGLVRHNNEVSALLAQYPADVRDFMQAHFRLDLYPASFVETFAAALDAFRPVSPSPHAESCAAHPRWSAGPCNCQQVAATVPPPESRAQKHEDVLRAPASEAERGADPRGQDRGDSLWRQVEDDAVMVCRSGCIDFGDGGKPLDEHHCWACGISYRMRRIAALLYPDPHLRAFAVKDINDDAMRKAIAQRLIGSAPDASQRSQLLNGQERSAKDTSEFPASRDVEQMVNRLCEDAGEWLRPIISSILDAVRQETKAGVPDEEMVPHGFTPRQDENWCRDCCYHRDHQIHQAEAQPVPQGWQPIESCPKMRTVLLFAVTFIKDDGTVGNWKMATGSWMEGYNEATSAARNLTPWQWDGRQLKSYDPQPTHWMPLPTAPVARRHEDQETT